jgi:TonB-dependent starch-binding outer membrane protein SusC
MFGALYILNQNVLLIMKKCVMAFWLCALVLPALATPNGNKNFFENSPTNLFDVIITGTVTDENGNPLEGATVEARGVRKRTVTDKNGKFSIALPDGTKSTSLFITYVGFASKTVTVQAGGVVAVRLASAAKTSEEVVVVGYGTAKRKQDLSGAVTNVSSEFITNQNITSVDQGLAGLLPGVTLREGTGAPGAGPEILIRGINTFGNNKPLVIIDDVIYEDGNDQNNNPLALLNPEDVANIVVLKDAASKAIYGARATAGVILITTKKGTIGRPKVSFSQSIASSAPMGFENPDVLNAQELAQFRKEKFTDDLRLLGNNTFSIYRDPKVPVPDSALLRYNANVAPFLNPSQYGVGTNWYEEVTQTALVNNSNLSVNGGTDNIKYYISGNFLNQEGVVIQNDIKRYSLRANVDVKASNKLRMGVNFAPSRTDANRPADDPGNGQFSAYGTITSTYWIDPSVPVYQPNGFLTYTTRGPLASNWTANPIYQLNVEQERRRSTQMIMGGYLEIEPFKNLTFKTSVNYNYTTARSTNFQPSTLVGDGSLTPVFPNVDSGRAVLFNSALNNFINDNILRYKFKRKKHDATIMVGYNVQQQTNETSNLNARKIIDENFIFPTSTNVSLNNIGNFTGTTGYSRFRFLSNIARLNYSFGDRYLLDLSIRRDGSSRFGRNVQYSNFPAGSIAWRVTQEKFMQKLKGSWLNELRFEAGYGITGNAGGLGAYTHLGGISPANYYFGNSVYSFGNTLTTPPNPLITWEEAEQLDLGLNAALFKRRVSISFNWYRQITQGALAGIPLSNVTGFGSVVGNQPDSKIQNKGFEATLDVAIINRKDFRWSTGINASQYRNKLVSYYLPNGFLNGNAGNGTQVAISKPGEALGTYRGLRILGVYSAADIANPAVPKYAGAREGGTKYFDGNGDGILNGNIEQDYVLLGNPHPDLMFGFNHQLQYKQFTLRAIFAGQLGGLIYDLRREIMWNVDGNFNVNREILKRWRPGDDPATAQFGSTAFNTNLYRIPSDNKIYDASYLALKNLTIGYNLTSALNTKKKMFQNAEFTISMRNVFYVAAYKFGNPETRRSNDGSALRGLNYGSYPVARTLSVGLNIAL